ncbi:hypothetical protein KGM_212077A, partial [Danaus plexippus plexippus]
MFRENYHGHNHLLLKS